MFASKSVALALIALTYVSLALNPLAFIKGMNSKLDLENDNSINECLTRIIKNSEEESHACLDAMDSYLIALFASSLEASEDQTTEVASIETVGAIFRALENFSSEKNFEAGQETAQLFKQLALNLRIISHERRISDTNITINYTEFVLGLNAQLAATPQAGLEGCLEDSSQTDVIVKALEIALQQKNAIQAVSDILKLVKYLPGIQSSCATSVQGIQTYAKPIEQSLFSNATDFFNLINANLQKNPFAVATETISIVNDLKAGKDYNAGVTSGKIVKIALKGIIN